MTVLIFEETRKKIIETREWTKKELRALGFTFGDSMSNFIFASHERVPATELFEALRRDAVSMCVIYQGTHQQLPAHQHRNERREWRRLFGS